MYLANIYKCDHWSYNDRCSAGSINIFNTHSSAMIHCCVASWRMNCCLNGGGFFTLILGHRFNEVHRVKRQSA